MIEPAIARLLESYFDRIFVISIARASERQARVKEHLEGLSFEFFTGTDKQTLDWPKITASADIYDEAKSKKFNRVGKGMIAGEVACALSHRRLYSHIIEMGYKRVLVFEDDVVPLQDNLSLLPSVLLELPEDWDLIYFGYTKHEVVTPKLKRKQAFYRLISPFRLIKWKPAMVKNMLPVPYSPHLRKAGYHDCTHAYAITSRSATRLIAKQTPVAFNADNLLSDAVLKGELKAFVTEPKLFAQENHLDPQHKSMIHHL
jgi:glycosyl transferase family 25